jgi:hypothetical protein
MAIPTIPYADNQEAARALLHHIRSLTPPVRHLRLQPLDATRPASTLWWLTPTTGWAMHAHGRLFLRRAVGSGTEGHTGKLSAGFCVDRGLGRQLAGPQLDDPDVPDLVDPALTMQPSWFWTRFRNDALGGVIHTPMRAVLVRTEHLLNVELELHYADSAPRPGYRTMPTDDRLAFVILDTSLMLHPIEPARAELTPLNEVATMSHLVMHLEGLQDLSWCWISVRISVELGYRTPEVEATWSVAALWQRALEPWLPWLH